MSKTITLEIKPNGQVKLVDVTGFGGGCQDVTKALESRLGVEVPGSRADTASLYAPTEEATLSAQAS